MPLLRMRVGARLTVGGTDSEGRVEVEVTGPSVGMLVDELAGLGGRLLLVDPPEVRGQLASLASELGRLYGDADRSSPEVSLPSPRVGSR